MSQLYYLMHTQSRWNKKVYCINYRRPIHLIFIFLIFTISTCFVGTYKLLTFGEKYISTFRTILSGWFLPRHKITLWNINASKILTSFLSFTNDNVFSTLWTRNTYFFKICFCILQKTMILEKNYMNYS